MTDGQGARAGARDYHGRPADRAGRAGVGPGPREGSRMLTSHLEAREQRLLGIVLALGAVALFFIVVDALGRVFFAFGDILLTFFLAWLLAFIISPIVSRLVDAIPGLPRGLATIV